MNELILVIAILTTESSYKSEVERPATSVEDTIQFCFGADLPWRIRTYAIDHDIHTYTLGNRNDGTSFSQGDAEAHIHKNYEDILKNIYVIHFKNPQNSTEVSATLKSYGLTGTLEVASAGFAFYNPDSAKYKSQSEPK